MNQFPLSRILAVLMICIVLVPAFGQGSGSLRGVVTDQAGGLVPEARISVTGGLGPRAATSGKDGAYSVTGLAPGRYSVRATAPGLTQGAPASVDVGTGVATLDLILRVTLEKQEITVSEQGAGQVSTDSSQNASSLSVTGDALDAIADDPDDLQADLAALAGPAAGPSGGQIFIDGFSAGDGALPAKSSIREIRINQNPFAAEFDAIGFGRTEILTKPGMDRFRGSVGMSYGNAAINSRNPFAREKAPFDLKDYSGNVGGALSKKASFFVDIASREINNGIVMNAVTLDPASLAITPFSGVVSSPNSRQRLSPRLDYQLTPGNTLTFRYGFTRTKQENSGIGGFVLPTRAINSLLTEHAYQGVETAVINSHVVNEVRFQLLRQHNESDAVKRGVSIGVAGAFSGGGPSNPDHDYIHHHYELQDYVMIAQGAHNMKVGFRLRATEVFDDSSLNFDGAYTFGSIQQYQTTLLLQRQGLDGARIRQLGGGAAQFVMTRGKAYASIGQVDMGFFANDDWRVRPNLTLTYGLRYETQTNITDRRAVSPRLGLAWAPGGKGGRKSKTVLRGGFGIFYERFEEQNGLLAERFNGLNQAQYTLQNPDMFPLLPTVLPTAAIARRTVDKGLRAPYILQTAMGVERQLPHNTTLAVTWTGSHGVHMFRTRNINAPLPGTYTGAAGSGVFPFGSVGPIYQMESAGLYNQNLIVANVNAKVNNKVSLFGFYTFSRARSNTDGVSSSPANQYSMAGEYGPASTDIRARGNIGGTLTSIWNLRLSPLIVMQTGAPFDIVSGQDAYGTTLFTARPGISTDPTRKGLIPTRYGLLDPNPIAGQQLISRHAGRGPGIFSVDLRLSRTFALRREHAPAGKADDPASGPSAGVPSAGPSIRHGTSGFGDALGVPGAASAGARHYNLTVSVAARNALNRLNPGPIIGNINSPLFGRSNSIGGGSGAFGGNANNRRLEFQVKLDF